MGAKQLILDFNDSDTSEKYAFQSINHDDIMSQSGIALHFITDSNSVRISFNMKYIEVEPFKSPISTNGIYYVISTPEGKMIKCNDLYYKNGEYFEELISTNDSKDLLYYQIFLPIFNDIYNFKVILDDDCNIKEIDYLNKILVIGSSVTKGKGCIMPTSAFSNELLILLKVKVYTITENNFYELYDKFGDYMDLVKKINPQIIIIEYMFKNYKYILEDIIERIKDLCKKVFIITDNLALEIKSPNVVMIRTDCISDDGSISKNVVNDYFNYKLTEMIVKELKGAEYDQNIN